MNKEEKFYYDLLKLKRDFILKHKVSPNAVNVSVDTFCYLTGANTTRYQPAYMSEDGKDRYMGMLLKISNERDTFVSIV